MPKSRKRKNRKSQKSNGVRPHKTSPLGQDYADTKIDLYQEVSQPSYENIMNWMKHTISGRCMTYDFWARGNYTRRMIHQRNLGIEPLLVQVSYVDELRWAYRRLALLGLPVEFVYCGKLNKLGKCIHVDVSQPDMLWDSGWGYIATIWKAEAKYWAMIIGYARLMPEPLLDWLVEEACEDFIEGKVFITPSELIGIKPQAVPQGLNQLASISKGIPLTSDYEIVKAALELDIPFLDNMSSFAFKEFLNDYEGELVQFRRAFKNLVKARGKSEAELKDYLEELKYEIAELTMAAKHHGMRGSIGKLGGILATFTASFTMALNTQPTSLTRLIGAAGIGAASKALLDLFIQSTEREQKMPDNPYFILWKLGVSRPSEVSRKHNIDIGKAPKLSPKEFNVHSTHHWLCPPTAGVNFLVNEKKADE